MAHTHTRTSTQLPSGQPLLMCFGAVVGPVCVFVCFTLGFMDFWSLLLTAVQLVLYSVKYKKVKL